MQTIVKGKLVANIRLPRNSRRAPFETHGIASVAIETPTTPLDRRRQRSEWSPVEGRR